MPADVSIVIKANSDEAIKAFNDTQDASLKTSKSLLQLRNNLIKTGNAFDNGQASIEDFVKAQNLYLNKGNQQLAAYLDAFGKKGLDNVLNTLKSYYATIQASTPYNEELTNNLLKQIDAIESAVAAREKEAEAAKNAAKKQKEALDVQKKALEEFTRASKLAKEQQLDYEVMVALGDQVGILQEKYKALDHQLRESIKCTGTSSEKTKALANEMKGLSEQIKKANYTPFNVRIKNLLSSFVSAQAILWGVRSAFRLVTNTITESMQAASAAEETFNLFVTTFDEVETSALNTASAISSSMGLASSTAQKALGTFGDLAIGYGQTDAAALEFAETLTKTSLDLISYKNISGSYDEIFSNIASGIAGNVENFRRLGVVITQAEIKTRLQQKGLDKLTGSSLQYAQMQERMNILIEKTANAQGDMIKTMESTENVTRRLNEATKEWKENFGTNWNKVFTPIKSALADYIEEINRANEAQKLFFEGRTDIQTYSGLTPEERQNSIASAIKGISFTNKNSAIANLERLLVSYQATYEEFIDVVTKDQNMQALSFLERNEEALRSYVESYTSKNKANAILEEENRKIQDLQKSYENLEETLNMIEGIDFKHIWQEVKVLLNPTELADVAAQERGNLSQLFSELAVVIESLTNKELPAFSTAVENAFSLEDKADQLEDKLESFKKLWEELYNFFTLTEGISTEEQAILNSIVASYNQVNAELDAHNKKIEEEKERLLSVENALKSISTTAEDFRERLAKLKLEETVTANMPGASEAIISNEVARQSELASLASLTEKAKQFASIDEFDLIESEAKKVAEAINIYYDAIKKSIEAEELKEREEKRQNAAKEEADRRRAILEAYNTARNWNAQPYIPTFSTNAVAQKEAESLYAELGTTLNTLANELKDLGISEDKIEDYVSLIKEQGLSDIKAIAEGIERQEFNKPYQPANETMIGGLGEAYDIMNVFTSGASVLGGLVSVFADLVVQTEAFQKVASLLTDNVLPVLNAFLEPLLPVIDMLGNQIQMVAETVLAPLFPLMKSIAKVATIAYGITNIAIGFVRDGVKIITGLIVTGVTELINMVIDIINKIPFVNVDKIDNQWAKDWMNTDIFGNVKDKWDEMNKHLASIDKMSMEVANNTDPDKNETLSIYKDLYNRQMLSSEQYAGLISSLSNNSYDNVGLLSSGLTYQKKGSGTYVAKQNISITINGSELSQEQLTAALRDALEASNSYGGNTYSVGVA